MKGRTGKIIAEFHGGRGELEAGAHLAGGIQRCRAGGVRKVLDRGFFRDRWSRGGYHRECKKCRNLKWARGRFEPKTGRRYVTKGNRGAQGRGKIDYSIQPATATAAAGRVPLGRRYRPLVPASVSDLLFVLSFVPHCS